MVRALDDAGVTLAPQDSVDTQGRAIEACLLGQSSVVIAVVGAGIFAGIVPDRPRVTVAVPEGAEIVSGLVQLGSGRTVGTCQIIGLTRAECDIAPSIRRDTLPGVEIRFRLDPDVIKVGSSVVVTARYESATPDADTSDDVVTYAMPVSARLPEGSVISD